MNYLYEKRDGTRVRLTKKQYDGLVRKHDEVRHLIKTDQVRVLCHVTHKPVDMTPFKPKKGWGGSRRQKNCFDPTYSRGQARVHQVHLD